MSAATYETIGADVDRPGHPATRRLRSHRWLPALAIASALCFAAPAPAEATEGWTALTGPAVATWGASATVLSDGRVLVVGGESSEFNPVKTAELFDPVTDTWRPTAGMSTARTGHQAVRLNDGRVLVAGGADGTASLRSAEIYDPATETWSSPAPLAVPRFLPSAALLPDGRVLFAGGATLFVPSAATPTAEIYDPSTGSWAATASMTSARYNAGSTTLADGRVLVAGGYANGFLSQAELFDPATGTWAPTGSMATARASYPAVLLPDGRVLAPGGETHGGARMTASERFSPSSGSWAAAAPLPGQQRNRHAAVLLPNGNPLVVGGTAQSGSLTDVVEYDPSRDSWTAAPPLHSQRSTPAVASLPDGRVLVAGGFFLDHDGAMRATAGSEVYGTIDADLHVSISAQGDAQVGDSLDYAVAVGSNGPATAYAVTVTDTLPAGVKFVSASDGGAYDPETRRVTWRLERVPAGASDRVLRVTARGEAWSLAARDQATVASGAPDPDSGNDTATSDTRICTRLGGPGNDHLTGTGGNDLLCGAGGDDTLNGGAGSDHLQGDSGSDTVTYPDAPHPGVYVNLATQRTLVGDDDYLASIENATGSPQTDFLLGDDGPNVLRGSEDGTCAPGYCSAPCTASSNPSICGDVIQGYGGADELVGGDGYDWIGGGEGDDRLYGHAAYDALSGGPGNDVIDGGPGEDSVVYLFQPSPVQVDRAAGTATGEGDDSIVDVSDMIGSPRDDTLSGDDAPNRINGFWGHDTIDGRGGDDPALWGDRGNDTLHGGMGDDQLDGGPGRDSNFGDLGTDTCAVDAADLIRDSCELP